MLRFFTEDTVFSFRGRLRCRLWFRQIADNENRRLGDVNVIFCSDPYLLAINRRFLQHDYYTDVITFDYCSADTLSGDIFISVDTVRANAAEFGSSFEDELHRVMVHGLLHLIGYDDHSDAQRARMRAREDACLSLLGQL